MASSGEEYVIYRRKKIERRQKIVTIISIVSFVGSTALAIVPGLQQASQNSTAATTAAESSLKQQERGLELVLQREPENQIALDSLVNIRIQQQNTKGAIEPLEKLVKLHPERQDYKVQLEQLKKQQSKSAS